ncbi:MAG: hypothetical protein IJX87_00335 [Clostridia bacterium]|nr:hypothetical protein [Clostridia bacterium]
MRKQVYQKAGALLMVALLATASSCGALEEQGEQVNEQAAVLRVMNFDGGLGGEWLKDLEEKFEAAHANDTNWEKGKVGVDIVIDPLKFTGDSLGASIATHKDDVFFTEGNSYYNFVTSGWVKDITDVVTEVNGYDGKTIESKLDDEVRDFFKTNDNKYYALPFYSAYEGINYDIDLFDDMSFYFEGDTTKEGTPAKYVTEAGEKVYSFTDLSGTRSAGPNGKAGDYDDGLPATYEQFYAMCDNMKMQGVTPMLWNNHAFYMSYFMGSLQADYEGKDAMMANFTFGDAKNKTIEIVDGFNEDGTPNIVETTISNTNGYEVYSQAGRYYALDFVNTMIQEGYVSTKAFGSNENGIVAQTDFLNGKYSEKKETVAMLIEGTWWENEADAVFKTLEGTEGAKASRKNRRLGFMPFPKATEEKIGEPLTTMNINQTAIFVKSSISDERYQLAKEWIKFVLSDAGLNTFTKYTNTSMLYNYQIEDEIFNELSPYGKSVYEIKQNSIEVYPASKNELFLSNSGFFSMHTDAYWNSSYLVNGTMKMRNSPITPFREKEATPIEYFEGVRKYAEDNWERNFSKYFEK